MAEGAGPRRWYARWRNREDVRKGSKTFALARDPSEDVRMNEYSTSNASGVPSTANSQVPLVGHATSGGASSATAVTDASLSYLQASRSNVSPMSTPGELEGSTPGTASPIQPLPTPSLQDDQQSIKDVLYAEPERQYTKQKAGRLRDPISTITSSLLGLGKSSKHSRQKEPIDGNSSGSSSATLTGSTAVKPVSTKGSQSGDSSLDQELGHNGGTGNEGVLRRVYDTWALTSIATCNIGPIAADQILLSFAQGAFFGVHTAKEYGGYSMLSIAWPLSGIFMCLFAAVLAEMSSSYPVAGAMYTWTFRLCRLSPVLRPLARFLSWLSGSFLLCGHILAQMVVEWQIATILQGLIVIYAPDYQPTTWRTIFFAWAGLVVSATVAASSFGRNPLLWKFVSGQMAVTVIMIVVCVFACAPSRNSASYIFTTYENDTGFTNKGYVYLLGWVLTTIATGYDVAGHLAEEAKNPTKTVPMALFWSTAISYLAGWVLMLSLMAVSHDNAHGPDALIRDYSAPAQILAAVLPRPLAFVVLVMILFTMEFQDIAQLLASSRFVWALSRDSAIPLSTYFRHLSVKKIPVRATWIICAVVAPSLMLIAIDRKIATSLMLQGCGGSLVLAYAFPVICYLFCEKGALEIDGRNEWTLRGWSKSIAAVAMAYVALIIGFMAAPSRRPMTASSISYAPVVLVVVAILSFITWVIYGNLHYAGPIKSITVYTVGHEVELPKTRSHLSSNRHATPNSAKPSTPIGIGLSTTQLEVGKTANLYSESLASLDWRHQQGRGGAPNASQSGFTDASSAFETDYTGTDFTDTQATDMTESVISLEDDRHARPQDILRQANASNRLAPPAPSRSRSARIPPPSIIPSDLPQR